MIASVRRDGVVRGVAFDLVPANTPTVPVEVSAVLLTEGDQERLGFTIRNARQAVGAPTDLFGASRAADGLMASLANLTRQLGTSPMSVLMKDAGRLIEQHFIESALKRSAGDPAAAAALLGVSREAIESNDKAVGGS